MKKPRCFGCSEIIRKYQVTDPISKNPFCSWDCMRDWRKYQKVMQEEVTQGEIRHAKQIIRKKGEFR